MKGLFAGAQCFAKVYPQRLDDLAWENEYCAFRTYGPALQKKGEHACGYDIWIKNTHDTIVDLRYRLHFPPEGSGIKRKSFHLDWGNGMDKYDVGASLGCGTSGLLDENDSIILPWCWEKYDFIENTPERVQIHLVYSPYSIYKGKAVKTTSREHRIITCQKGSRFNKCEVWFEGLNETRKIATGIVLHPNSLDGSARPGADSVVINKRKKYIAYVDLQNEKQAAKDGSDGRIYIGACCPEAVEFKISESHVLTIATLKPGQHYTYWFGATWSKMNIHSLKEWKKTMSHLIKI